MSWVSRSVRAACTQARAPATRIPVSPAPSTGEATNAPATACSKRSSPPAASAYHPYFLAVFGTSSVLGPVIGGFFAGTATILGVAGWRWVFLVNVPIGIAALFVVSRTLHLKDTRPDHRIDFGGAAALAVGLVPLLLVAEQGRDWGWGSTRSLAC